MKSDKEKADELDAQDRLRARGYQWKTCHHCKGTGYFVQGGKNSKGEEFAAALDCLTCKGRGGLWQAPIT